MNEKEVDFYISWMERIDKILIHAQLNKKESDVLLDLYLKYRIKLKESLNLDLENNQKEEKSPVEELSILLGISKEKSQMIKDWIDEKERESKAKDSEIEQLKIKLTLFKNELSETRNELHELKNNNNKDALGFAEYMSSLCISNYKSGGNWYLPNSEIKTTQFLFDKYKAKIQLDENKKTH